MNNRLYLMMFFSLLAICIGCKQNTAFDNIILEELTISQIHEDYKSGYYNSEELVLRYIRQIENYDSLTNAISIINPDALSIAKSLDKEFSETGVLRPLHGIPIIVKDNINTKGLPTSAGALALKEFIPDEDAFIIKQLVNAGAIVFAKSNMAEWAFSARHTESSTRGTTRNPYNLNHVPAGSSGGTGAAIAANMGVIGLGTDTGNSIRGPSSHNSLVGFRTTLGLVSRSAIVPLYLRNDVVGPMCRTVEDATRMLEVIAGRDKTDPITEYSTGKIPDNYVQFLSKDSLKGIRIAVFSQLTEDIDPEIQALFLKALDDMKALGAEIINPVIIPHFDQLSSNQWCAEFRKDVESFLETYVKNDTMSTLEDIIRVGTNSNYAKTRLENFRTRSGRYDSPEIPCLDAYTDERRIAYREGIENSMDSLNLDVLVYPSWNYKPATIENFYDGYKGDNSQIVAPHTGQPAFSIPMGFTKGNLPAGIQFLGRMYSEPILIEICYAYEQASKNRKAPWIKK